jgi:hypothetical protein
VVTLLERDEMYCVDRRSLEWAAAEPAGCRRYQERDPKKPRSANGRVIAAKAFAVCGEMLCGEIEDGENR